MKGGDSSRAIQPYVTTLDSRFPRNPKIVGAIAAVNGKVAASDVFGDPALFRKLWPKLLRSYAAEAAESASSQTPARAIHAGEAAKFYADAHRSGRKTETRTPAASNERYDAKDARAYRLVDRAAGAAASPPVHENIIRK
jgi:hypothetical protein